MKQIKIYRQKGFTLIELVIVVVILGVLALVVSRTFGSTVSNSSKANALYEATNKITANWALLALQANSSTVVASSNLILATKTAEDVIVGGAPYVAAAYQSAWTSSGIIPMTDIAQGVVGSGAYTILSYPILIGGGGGNPLSVTFRDVPEEVILQIVQKHGTSIPSLAASDLTDRVVQYGVATSGLRDLTILKSN